MAKLWTTGRARSVGIAGVLAALLVFAAFVGVSVGSVAIPISDVWFSVIRHMFGVGPGASDALVDDLVWEQRAPRAVLGMVAGCGLALAGAVLQTAVRNPLAEPYILGVSAGASVAAVAWITLVGGATLGSIGVSAAAFVGALIAVVVVLALGYRAGRMMPIRLVLAGVSVGYLLQAVTSYLQIRATPDQLSATMFWLLGSLAGASWGRVGWVAGVVALAAIWSIARSRTMNLMLIDDDAAASSGAAVTRLRIELLILAALTTGAVVAAAGGIGFVGLIVPHVVRLLIGGDHRRLIPATAALGAAYLVLVDAIGRVISSAEMPLGILTAIVGVPFLLWLLRRNREVA